MIEIKTIGGEEVLLRAENISGHIDIPEGVEIINENAFWCSSVQSITIPKSVKGIGTMAFGSCEKLTEVEFQGSICTIGNAAFKRCTSLQRIILPDNMVQISEEMFAQCTSLKEIRLPDTISSIGKSAFHRCTSLEEVTIPISTTLIGDDAFLACSSLKRINLNITETNRIYISDTAFRFFEGLVLVVSHDIYEECRMHPVLSRFSHIVPMNDK